MSIHSGGCSGTCSLHFGRSGGVSDPPRSLFLGAFQALKNTEAVDQLEGMSQKVALTGRSVEYVSDLEVKTLESTGDLLKITNVVSDDVGCSIHHRDGGDHHVDREYLAIQSFWKTEVFRVGKPQASSEFSGAKI